MPFLSVSASVNSISWTIFDLSSPWTTANYSSAYIQVRRNGNLVGTSAPSYPPASGTSRSVSGSFFGLVQGTTYTADSFAVARNGIAYAAGSATFTTSIPPDTTPPTVPNLTLSNRGTNWITVYATSSDSGSGLSGFLFRMNGGNAVTQYQSQGGAFCTFTGLTPNTSYGFSASAFDAMLNYSSYSLVRTFTTLAARPQDYNFSQYVGSGNSTTQLTASSWNTFTARINAFRIYKSLGATSFTSASTGGAITANMFNQARNAINAMQPNIGVPATVTTNNAAFASLFNGLTRSLNSIQ